MTTELGTWTKKQRSRTKQSRCGSADDGDSRHPVPTTMATGARLQSLRENAHTRSTLASRVGVDSLWCLGCNTDACNDTGAPLRRSVPHTKKKCFGRNIKGYPMNNRTVLSKVATQKRNYDEFGLRSPIIQNTCQRRHVTSIVAHVHDSSVACLALPWHVSMFSHTCERWRGHVVFGSQTFSHPGQIEHDDIDLAHELSVTRATIYLPLFC